MVILVEDDDATRESIGQFLDSIGVEYKAASCKKEGLELLKENCPAILLTDMLLPDGDAKELIEYCKKYHTDCRSILITAIQPCKAREVAEELHIDKLILKPFDIEELETVIKETAFENTV